MYRLLVIFEQQMDKLRVRTPTIEMKVSSPGKLVCSKLNL